MLPEPYAMIVDVMQETILHKLNLSMHEIENKRKDENYEGNVKEYVAQNTIEIENICCLSEQSKTHNYLVVGDMAGQVYLLDLAKKVVFFKKELHSGRRVIHISETTISDGDNSITTLAVALNGHNKIYILRYLHSEPKLHLVYLIEVAPDDNNINRCPYSTLFDDYGRILFVYTYEGSILGYRVP